MSLPPTPEGQSERMRREWDERADRDALFYIASGTSENESFWRSGAQELADNVLSEVELGPEAAVLEIGCGIGRLLLPLAERVADVTGVDISPRMVEGARQACREASNVKVLATDGSLELPGASQDFVFSYIVFQHIPELRPIERYIQEAARVLRPGGVLHFQVDGRVRRRGGYVPNTYEGITLRGEELLPTLETAGLQLLRQWGEGTHYLWTTARRPGLDPRVRVVPRLLDVRELGDLAARLTEASASEVRIENVAGIREALEPFVRLRASEPPGRFVEETFRVVLAREPLPPELEFNRGILERGLERGDDWIDTIVSSPELRDRLMPPVPTVSGEAEARFRGRMESWGGTGSASGRGLGDLMMALASHLRAFDAEAAVQQAYRVALGREPDRPGLRYFARKLELGHFTRMRVLTELLRSEEMATGIMPAVAPTALDG